MKEKRGISLIVLIITIIIMIIIAGAIIISLSNANIIDQAEEATFKMQVRGIQDALLLEKADKLAEEGKKPASYNITMSSLGLDEDVFNKYNTKLYIDSVTGELYYQEGNVTANEEKWLIQLGIKGKLITQLTGFLPDVTTIVDGTEKAFGNNYDYYTISQSVKDKYENAATFVVDKDTGRIITSQIYDLIYYDIHHENETLKKLKVQYSEPQNVQLTLAMKEELREELGGEKNKDNINSFFGESTTVKELIDAIEAHIVEYGNDVNYVFVNQGEMVIVDDNGVQNYSQDEEYYILTGSELDNFTYTESEDDEEDNKVATIIKYNLNTNKIIIPTYIVKPNGEVLLVKEIASNAFATTKPIRIELTTTLFNQFTASTGSTYDEVDIATMKAIVEGFLSKPDTPYTVSGTYEDSKEGKNQLMIDHLLPNFLAEGVAVSDSYVLEGAGEEQKMYAMLTIDLDSNMPTIYKYDMNSEYVEKIDEIIIGEGITTIGDTIISGNYVEVIQIPTTLSTVSQTALANATLLKVRGRLDYYDLRSRLSSAFDGYKIFGSQCEESQYEQISD